jgi:flagellar protein FlaF
MYHAAYDEVMEHSVLDARRRENEAFDHSIYLLGLAARKTRYSQEAVEAIAFTSNLWSALISDLASPENQLAEQVRAKLISIGIWILGEADRIRKRLSTNFQGIIDVTATIRNGIG